MAETRVRIPVAVLEKPRETGAFPASGGRSCQDSCQFCIFQRFANGAPHSGRKHATEAPERRARARKIGDWKGASSLSGLLSGQRTGPGRLGGCCGRGARGAPHPPRLWLAGSGT